MPFFNLSLKPSRSLGQRLTLLSLVLLLGVWGRPGSKSAIAQDTPAANPISPDAQVEPETPPDPNDSDLGTIGEAENTEDLSPRLRPAANTGDMIGDFFSVSVTACTLDPELLNRKTAQELAELGIASAGLISQTTPASPSLWWPRDRFGQNDLVQNWLIDAEARRINLIVDRNRWSNLNYVQQYRVVHQFGTIAREQGYALRIFNPQPKCLAVYDCETVAEIEGSRAVQTEVQTAERQTCKVDMQPSRRDPFNFF